MRDRVATEAVQLTKLRVLLAELRRGNPFYGPVLKAHVSEELASLRQFQETMPFTTKDGILRDRLENPPYGTNLTYPREQYTRFCQSSGTASGHPMAVLDTNESWTGLLDVWDQVYTAAGVKLGETIFFAFSFGPFLGFWTAFEGAARRGNLCIPGGGLGSAARLELMARYGASVLCCTPTYAARLGEVLAESPAELRDKIAVRLIIVAGEPGGSIPATRARLEILWPGAKVCDHHGMTETGPVSFEHPDRPASLCVVEDAYFAEVIDSTTGKEVAEGEEGELVLTTLKRIASPLLRYRTGDLVKKSFFQGMLCLEGGILGRTDDMAVIRGVNIYPAAVERVVREFPEIVEFQVVQTNRNAMAEIEVRIEPLPEREGDVSLAERLAAELNRAFSLRIPVSLAEPMSLPRFEFKSKRWIKE